MCVSLGQEFCADADIPGGIIPEVFINTWEEMLSSGAGVIFGMEKDGLLVGMLGGVTYSDMNNGALVGQECFWFVSKEHRGGGIELLKAFEAWCIERGCKRWTMVYLVSSMPEIVEQIYRGRNYRPMEVHWLKEA